MVPLAALSIFSLVASWRDQSAIVFVVGVLSMAAALSMARVAVFLEAETLAVRHFVRTRRYNRSSVVRALVGHVQWGRSLVPGIEIERVDGTRTRLGFSYLLGEGRRAVWVREIDAWVAGRDG